MPKEINVKFHPKQQEAFLSKARYTAVIAGVQSGKTFLGCYWAAKQIAAYPEQHGIIAAPNYKILEQSTLAKFWQIFPSYQKFYKAQKSVIEFPNGSKIFIRSMDNPLLVEGITAKWAWMDEAGQMPIMAWTVIRSRVSATQGKVLITTTPYNMGWLYQDFYLPWKKKTFKDFAVYNWPSIDNPYFDKDHFRKEKELLRAEEFKRRYEGSFSRMEGLIYNLRQWHIISPKKLQPEVTIGGVDWGWNTAAIVIIKIANNRYYLVDEWYKSKKTTIQITEAMMKLQEEHGVSRWYADSANPEKITEASVNTGLYILPYEKKKDSITSGLSYIQQLLNENRFFVFNICKNTLKEFETYHYPEEGSITTGLDKPAKNQDDHSMDAMRYAVHGYTPARRFFFPGKPMARNFIERILNRKGDLKVVNNTPYE